MRTHIHIYIYIHIHIPYIHTYIHTYMEPPGSFLWRSTGSAFDLQALSGSLKRAGSRLTGGCLNLSQGTKGLGGGQG